MKEMQFDVIVVGAGHAGYEAALAAARLGSRVALVTIEKSAIGRMSCNPSIGGIAKSHIVCELDALGGELGRNTDYTGIQFRTLNISKGPAVQAHRVQCDKVWFPRRIAAVIDGTKNLVVVEGLVSELQTQEGRIHGVRISDGSEIRAQAVIIATGTFLRGLIHIGNQSFPGGRAGENAADQLSGSFERLGFRLGRLKTGTPPRLHQDSLEYTQMEPQLGFEPPPFLSWAARREWEEGQVDPGSGEAEAGGRTKMFHVEQCTNEIRPWAPGTDQIPCYLTRTTEKTHEIIRRNLKLSAMYGGALTGTGVRYCPSIEDKIVKFPDRSYHQVFVEPEGRVWSKCTQTGPLIVFHRTSRPS